MLEKTGVLRRNQCVDDIWGNAVEVGRQAVFDKIFAQQHAVLGIYLRGHALVEVLVFLSIVGGLAAAMQQYSRAVSISGGLALIVFGVMTAKGSKNATLVAPQGQVIGNAYLAGIITSAANPYFWIWWLSVGSALVLSGLKAGLIMAALFMIGHWVADFGWLILVSISLDRGRSILSERSYRRILGICGGFLVCFGIYFLSAA
jgi:threonine/homoserine/homoserine lactone efflux protein